jgi:urease accessory protein
MTSDIRLARLLQLASPALPVGAYSYSQGLEAAVEAGVVHDAESATAWIGAVLDHTVAGTEAPLLLRLIEAWRTQDVGAVARWNNVFLATRETAELRAETVQMGYSLARLLGELGPASGLDQIEEPGFPTAFARAVATWDIEPRAALIAYLWSWIENQVMAALKAVPLGQTDGQRLLLFLGERLALIADRAASVTDDELGSFAPRFAILSSRHETQYSRLFRS